MIKAAELAHHALFIARGWVHKQSHLLESDGMGYGMTKTVIPVGERQHWHYKNHLESCYCVSGKGLLTNAVTGEYWAIGRT